MSKLLNLDDLSQQEERVLILGGVDYPMTEMTVKDFIEINQDAQALKGETDPGTLMETTINLIQRSFPTCPREVLLGLGLTKLNRIMKFTSEAPEEVLEEAAAGEAGNEQKAS